MPITDAMVEAASAVLLGRVNAPEQEIYAAARAALTAALSQDEWQDVEANPPPEDGSVVLVYRPDAGVFTAHYVEEDAHLASPLNPPEGDCYWFSTSGDDLTEDMPTHWRPLPAPPLPTQEEG